MAGYLEGCAHVSFCWIAQDQSPFPILWKLGPVCSLMANLLNVVVVSYMPKLFIPIWHPLNFFFSTGFGSNSSPSRIEICIFLLSTQNHNNGKYGEEQHIRRFSRNHPVIEKQKEREESFDCSEICRICGGGKWQAKGRYEDSDVDWVSQLGPYLPRRW